MSRRSWTNEELELAVNTSTSVRQVLKKLRLREAGGNYEQVRRYIDELKIDSSHFRGKGWSRGLRGIGVYRIPLKEVLVKNSTFQSHKLKNRLFKEGIKEVVFKAGLDLKLPANLNQIQEAVNEVNTASQF